MFLLSNLREIPTYGRRTAQLYGCRSAITALLLPWTDTGLWARPTKKMLRHDKDKHCPFKNCLEDKISYSKTTGLPAEDFPIVNQFKGTLRKRQAALPKNCKPSSRQIMGHFQGKKIHSRFNPLTLFSLDGNVVNASARTK